MRIEITVNEPSFVSALQTGSLSALSQIPKSDLHSHAGRGGHISYIERCANVKISPPDKPFDSLAEMNLWLKENVKCHLPQGAEGYLKQIEASFAQAAADNIAVLAMSFCADEIDRLGGMAEFTYTINKLRDTFAPGTSFYPDLGLGYFPDEVGRLDELFSSGWFCGIDIMNYSGVYTMKELKRISRKAKDAGVTVKAHTGEFGTADDVFRCAEELQLDQIQHGVLAVRSPRVMRFLADNHIQLNVCPTSNIMLKVCGSFGSHPIRTLYENGVPVTVNTDDLLIFNSTVSEEFLKLYNAGMSASDLDTIRKNGLQYEEGAARLSE